MKAADQNSSLFCQSEDRSMKKLSSVNTAESAMGAFQFWGIEYGMI